MTEMDIVAERYGTETLVACHRVVSRELDYRATLPIGTFEAYVPLTPQSDLEKGQEIRNRCCPRLPGVGYFHEWVNTLCCNVCRLGGPCEAVFIHEESQGKFSIRLPHYYRTPSLSKGTRCQVDGKRGRIYPLNKCSQFASNYHLNV